MSKTMKWKDLAWLLLAKVYCGGYSIREVAQELGISVGACKMRLRRAKDRLRKKLE